LPAIIRGDIFSSVNLYLPFVFGYLLKRCVQQCSDIFSRTDDVYCNLKVSRKDYITWVWKSAFELALVLIFLLVCHFMKAETRILVNFFIASFVCPLIRAALPQVTNPQHLSPSPPNPKSSARQPILNPGTLYPQLGNRFSTPEP
jgi:hypothetical protein